MGVRPVDVSLGALSKFFPPQQIEEILRANKREEKRRRKLPSLEVMYFLIALGLHASEGCRAVLRRVLLRKGSVAQEALDRMSSDSAISQARSRLGWKPIRESLPKCGEADRNPEDDRSVVSALAVGLTRREYARFGRHEPERARIRPAWSFARQGGLSPASLGDAARERHTRVVWSRDGSLQDRRKDTGQKGDPAVTS
jgi:hypothetical protein